MNLKGKTIILTGATGGIGSVLASHLAHKDANLILLGRNQDKLDALASSLRGQSSQVSTYTCNLTNRTARDQIVQKILDNHPTIDILINNAGIGIYHSFPDITSNDWYNSYELNVHTPFFLSQSLAPTLTVNIGSCSGVQYRATRTLYNSTKAALRSLTLCMAQDKPDSFIHITLNSTLTSFGPLTLDEKAKKQQDGLQYLSPDWVTNQIINIIQDNSREPEYVLSPHCYDRCGTWKKP